MRGRFKLYRECVAVKSVRLSKCPFFVVVLAMDPRGAICAKFGTSTSMLTGLGLESHQRS